MSRVSLLLPFLLMLPCGAQITIDLSHGPPYTRHIQTHAANGDPNAKTPEEIVALNERLAAEGNADAAYQLGLAYLQGLGEPQDLQKAVHWFEVGAVRPEDKAMVGEFYQDGEYFPKDQVQAIRWFKAAGRTGDLFTVAQIYQRQMPPDFKDAAAMYRELLKKPESAEFRRAQMELGNLVLDGRYSAGDDAAGRALNLEWARTITQELVGQQEYTIAVAYSAAVDGVPHDEAMWLRFCKRAAAYNMDLAQQFYGRALINGKMRGTSRLEGYAWVRLSADKQYGNRPAVAAMEEKMSAGQRTEAQSIFDGLVQTRVLDGAYYVAGDPLREPSAEALKAMPDDDPDVQLRRAFALEKSADAKDYEQAMRLYRIARDRRGMDIKVVLGRDHMYGTNGVPKDARLARYWLRDAAQAGSRPAALWLAKWYSGDGDGKVDVVQSLTWELIGHEGGGAVAAPAGVTPKERAEALRSYRDWLLIYPQWIATPNRLAD